MRRLLAAGFAGIGFLVLAASAQAAPIVNADFEDGLTGWTVSGTAAAIGAQGSIDAPQGALMAYIDNGSFSPSSISQTFDALTEALTFVVAFMTNEGTPSGFNDRLEVIGSTGTLMILDTFATFSVGGSGFDAATAFVSVVVPVGTTSLEFRILDVGDAIVDSGALIDLQGEPTPGGDVPEPATLGLVGLGLLGLAAARRRRAA